MSVIVLIFGVLIALGGIVGVVKPALLLSALRAWQGHGRWLVAVIVRLVMGLILIEVAPELRFPVAIKVIGVITFVAGIGLLMIGQKRMDRIIDWFLGVSETFVRNALVLAFLFGIFLVYAAY